jgi:hypothetical protein
LLAWVLLAVVVAGLWAPVREVTTGSDAMWYLVSALNLAQGKGYVDAAHEPILQRPPLFPLLTAAWMKATGWDGLRAGLWLVRGIGVLTILLVAFIAATQGGMRMALMAASFLVSSRGFNPWVERILVDGVFPFLALGASWLLWRSMDEGRLRWVYAVSGGVVMGMAFGVKEFAVVFLALPFLVVAAGGGTATARRAGPAVVFLGILTMAVVGWLAHATGQKGLGVDGFAPEGKFVTAFLFQGDLSGYLRSAWTFLSEYFFTEMRWASGHLLAWAVCAVLAAKGDRFSRWLVCSLIPFLPIALFVGHYGVRAGNLVYIYVLTLLNTSYLLHTVGCRLQNLRQGPAIVACVWATCLAVPWVSQWRDLTDIARRQFNPLGLKPVVVQGGLSSEVVEIHGLLDRLAPEADSMLCTWQYRDAFYYLWHGERRMPQVPFGVGYHAARRQDAMPRATPSGELTLLFLRAHVKGKALEAITEEHLLGVIAAERTRYVIVTPRHAYLRCYLDLNPSFNRLGLWSNGQRHFALYEVGKGGARPIRPEPAVDPKAVQLAKALHANESRYRRDIEQFLTQRIGYGAEKASRFLLDVTPVDFVEGPCPPHRSRETGDAARGGDAS